MKTILNLKPFVMKPEVHDDLTRIKERLRILDDKKKKVAKIIGITDVYLSYILNGKRPLTNNVKDKLFEYLGLNWLNLIGLTLVKSQVFLMNNKREYLIFSCKLDQASKSNHLCTYDNFMKTKCLILLLFLP